MTALLHPSATALFLFVAWLTVTATIHTIRERKRP